MVAGQNNSNCVGVEDSSSDVDEDHCDLVGCVREGEGNWVRMRGGEGGDNEQVTGRVVDEGERQTYRITRTRWPNFLYGNHRSWN